MAWLDDLLLWVAPLFIVMSILAVLVPAVRRRGAWRAIGAGWLMAFVASLIVAVTHLDAWGISCGWLGLIRTGVTDVSVLNGKGICSSTNALPLWLTALPALLGIGVMFGVLWRHARSLPDALRTIAALAVVAAAIIGIGQVSATGAFLVVVAIGIGFYAWPRLEGLRAT